MKKKKKKKKKKSNSKSNQEIGREQAEDVADIWRCRPRSGYLSLSIAQYHVPYT